MYSERQKRDASLGVLEKLRSKGMPSRPEEDVESMFEVAVNDTGTGTEVREELTEEEKKKKDKAKDKSASRPPNLIPSGVEVMKSAFRKQR